MTNEELLLEYEIAIAAYIAAVEKKNEETTVKCEKYLCELRTEILKRMEQTQIEN